MAKLFCCSIEMEPKTLTEGQLNHAREVAVGIVQNREPHEASSVFVQGLKPVMGIEEIVKMEEEEEMKKKNEKEGCQCSLTSAIIDSPSDQSKLKEPFSAPF